MEIPFITLTSFQYAAVMAFKYSDSLARFWARKGRVASSSRAKMPDLWVSCEGPMAELEGVLIACDIDGPPNSVESFDLDGQFSLLTEDGTILQVNGWIASEIKIFLINPSALAE